MEASPLFAYKSSNLSEGRWTKSRPPDKYLIGKAVHGLGIIGLPLSERGAVELRKACHQAPFGKGSETIIDTRVRNTWELNADQFEIRNQAWQAALDQTLQQVAKALGVAGDSAGIRAELYKLLWYDDGAFFDSHTDTEKVPGMIGSLVIALPSKHTGGDVQARFGGIPTLSILFSPIGFDIQPCASRRRSTAIADKLHEALEACRIVAGKSFRITGEEALKEILQDDFGQSIDLNSENLRAVAGANPRPATPTSDTVMTHQSQVQNVDLIEA
ncbi:MAG: hypothetical protein Q9173_002136 [Seirophora scorigena]